jgi:hypothetical protein
MAGAAWTRAEGRYLVPMITLAVLLANKALGMAPLRLGWNVVPFRAVEAIWQPVAGARPATGVFLQAIPQAFKAWASLNFHFSAIDWVARYTARQAIEPTAWGVLHPGRHHPVAAGQTTAGGPATSGIPTPAIFGFRHRIVESRLFLLIFLPL